jgi:hypothetical protein
MWLKLKSCGTNCALGAKQQGLDKRLLEYLLLL